MLWGRDLLKKGLRWRVASGRSVYAFKDPWLPRPKSFKPISVPTPHQTQLRVCDLMNEVGAWNWDIIVNTFWPVDFDEIKRIHVGFIDREDKLIWHYNNNGEYSVKSGYHLAQESEEMGSNGLRCAITGGLNKMWRLKIPSKIKIHLWRALFNALSVRLNLRIRRLNVDIICPMCHTSSEDVQHAFWYCKWRKIWKATSLWPLLSAFRGGSFVDLFSWVVDHGQGEDIAIFVIMVWSSWIERNKVLFEQKIPIKEEILARPGRVLNNFQIILPQCVADKSRVRTTFTCSPPPEDVYKINVDAAVIGSSDFYGIGLVGRDCRGLVFVAEGRFCSGRFSPHVAEMLAVKEGLLKAITLGWRKVIIESDAFAVIQAIIQPTSFSLDFLLVEDIQLLCSQLSMVSFQHCRRDANRAAHVVATSCLHNSCNIIFEDAIPFILNNVVKLDLIS